MIRQIVAADQTITRRKLKPVRRFDLGLETLVLDLIDTMIFANGAGLAANQIGVDAQIFVTGVGPKTQIFINPKLKTLPSKDTSLDEGCLSVPGYRGPVIRPTAVEISFQDLKGHHRKLTARGYLARVLQHEYDHLQGKIYLDHITDRSLVEKVVPTRVAFFGSGKFAVPIFVSLVGLNWTFDFQTVGVVTQPAKPAGRKKELTETPVFQTAGHFNLPVLTPTQLDQAFLKNFKAWQIDLIVLADYDKLLPPQLLKMPKYGGVNVHPSLLPKYRWSSPIQNAILNGDLETGVTIIQMNEKLDQGGILGQYKLPILDSDNYVNLSEKLANLGALALRDVLPAYVAGDIKPIAQPKEGVTTAPKLTKELGLIEPSDSAQAIVRKVRALNPWPGVYTVWKGKRIKILVAHLEENRLILDRLQSEGGKPMSWPDFKNGYPDFSLGGVEAS